MQGRVVVFTKKKPGWESAKNPPPPSMNRACYCTVWDESLSVEMTRRLEVGSGEKMKPERLPLTFAPASGS
jgi:hypothetical protein